VIESLLARVGPRLPSSCRIASFQTVVLSLSCLVVNGITDTLDLVSCGHSDLLRGPLHSVVNITLARAAKASTEQFTIRVLRHRFHEFDH
jgi:hypothetical protein